MASALHKAYANLFTTYPNAHQKDNEALRNFFSSHTDVGEATLAYMVRTFKTLAELADFESSTDEIEVDDTEIELDKHAGTTTLKQKQRGGTGGANGMTVNINIQLQLPATDNATIYENLFAALKKNLLS